MRVSYLGLDNEYLRSSVGETLTKFDEDDLSGWAEGARLRWRQPADACFEVEPWQPPR